MLVVKLRRLFRVMWLVVAFSLGMGWGLCAESIYADDAALYARAAREPCGNTLSATGSFTVYLPLVEKPDVCPPTGETYSSLAVANWEPAQRPAERHADLNLALRGYVTTTGVLGLVDIPGDTDSGAPQLDGLFAAPRAPNFLNVYQVYDWYWADPPAEGQRGEPIQDPEVTLVSLVAVQGEMVHVPDRLGGDIGGGYKALVLYASENRITLKYTREDTMATGYGLHLENICVDANLLALYRQLNDAGRHELPALRGGQAVGRVPESRVGVVVRDTGGWMEPRSRKDWWKNY